MTKSLGAPALLGAFALLAVPAHAAPQTVVGGQLDWTTANVYDLASPSGTNRTWLGYVTSPTPIGAPPASNGTATPSGAAFGTTVTPASARGADQLATWSYPAVGGTYDPETGTGQVKLLGSVTFDDPGHGFVISLEDPLVVFDGSATAKLFAAGRSFTGSPAGGSAGTYDRTSPVFTLDTAALTETTGPDGTLTLSGLAPAIATANYVFTSNYAVGAGPERTPNTFGGFSLKLVLPQSGPKGDAGAAGSAGTAGVAGAVGAQGAPGPAGPTGPAGPAGRPGKSATIRTVTLRGARAPFGPGASAVQLRRPGTGTVVGRGVLRGLTLRLATQPGATLRGTWTLRRTATRISTRRSATVRIG